MAREPQIDDRDPEIWALAGEAFRKARERALDAGISVLVVKDGEIVRLNPEGGQEFVKKLAPAEKKGLKLQKGVRTAIKWTQDPV